MFSYKGKPLRELYKLLQIDDKKFDILVNHL